MGQFTSKSIKNCILNIIPKEHSWKITLLENWGNIVGDLKKTITIEQIKEDALFLGVVHPAWAQEILALTPVLKQKINASLGTEHIKTIRVKLRQPGKRISTQNNSTRQPQYTEASLTNKEFEQLQKIDDLEFREIIKSFYLKCKGKVVK